jgi:hypothetical protein
MRKFTGQFSGSCFRRRRRTWKLAGIRTLSWGGFHFWEANRRLTCLAACDILSVVSLLRVRSDEAREFRHELLDGARDLWDCLPFDVSASDIPRGVIVGGVRISPGMLSSRFCMR